MTDVQEIMAPVIAILTGIPIATRWDSWLIDGALSPLRARGTEGVQRAGNTDGHS